MRGVVIPKPVHLTTPQPRPPRSLIVINIVKLHVFIFCREVIELDVLEEKIISTVIKHLSLSDTVRALPTIDNQQSESFMLLRAVMEEVYRRLDALIRQLQVCRSIWLFPSPSTQPPLNKV